MLQRAIGIIQGRLASGYRTVLRAKQRSKSWLRSVLEWLEEYDCFLCRGGEQVTKEQLYAPVRVALPELSGKNLKALEKLGVQHIGDLIDDSMDVRQWSLPSTCEKFRDVLPLPPTGEENLLWRGQQWLVPDGIQGEDIVIEIRDVLGDGTFKYFKWVSMVRGAETVDKDGTIYTGKIAEVFGDPRSIRVHIARRGRIQVKSHGQDWSPVLKA